MDEKQGDAADGRGARRIARLVNAYADALDANLIDYESSNMLIQDFNRALVNALVSDEEILAALVDPDEYDRECQRYEDEHRMKMAEREAQLKAGG